MDNKNPKIVLEEKLPQIVSDDLGQYLDDCHVSISLKYYMKKCECFSKWQKDELKKFSDTIDKVGNYSAPQLKNTKFCRIHKGSPAEARFSRPSSLSPDIPFYELKVDPNNKARVHGFFIKDVFFLCWLDRRHECFPES